MESTRFTIDPGQRSTPFRSTRSWTAAAILISAGLLSAGRDAAAQDPGVRKEARPEKSAEVEVRVFDRAGKLVGPVTMKKVVKTDAEWRAQLTKEQYEIAPRQGTERAYCGTLLDNQKEGAYSCVCCRLPLFGSGSKFKSGTGWPSFFRPIARENVAEKRDVSHGMVRTEILCARCDAHLGHVFRDGPRPTGLRYCLNSESLTFTEKKALGSLADPAAAKHRAARAVFAGGCFWCVEAVFEQLDGVIEVVSGYTGGKKKTASYRAVVSGTTGHAEAVRILYDPKKISYAKLLEVHFATHDPTTVNRQGADVGAQYRSSIFFANANEKRTAAAYIEQLTEAKVFERPIVTRLEPFQAFYPAEPHHQDYVCQNPDQPYVRRVALPKLEKVRKRFADRLKREAPPRR